ncbi:MAG TPA: 2-oxoacid:acceptor oxidoreductase family protein, partial [Calditrichia bacterium]|nr:2-oxoacid:acceptor oxidoreductase family protein [Calditrichia bacterium]
NGADLIVAFNEQALLGRLEGGHLKKSCMILLENKWRTHSNPAISQQYIETYDRLVGEGYKIVELPLEAECLKYTDRPQRGKNMFVLGVLSSIYTRELDIARKQITYAFRKKGQKVIDVNVKLLEGGYAWAQGNVDLRYEVPSTGNTDPQIVTNGNVATGLGVIASGMDICAMYPITPATSASHYLSEVFEDAGGIVHQAEDEIAACAFAIGSSYAGKCAVTITSGPGRALKTELIGLAVMAEIPLVLVNVQRGGPSTGLPTKVEQGDLMSAIFGEPGDAPKIVIAPATIEDCFYSVITARKIAETFRTVVMVLSDANLATGQQPFTRPSFNKEWLAPPIDQSPIPAGTKPYDWDPNTGLSRRFIPGQPGGMHTVTGLAHTQEAKVAYGPGVNQSGCDHRSLKLAAFQKTLKTPTVFGGDEGDLLLVGWGSTKGSIEEAVTNMREAGLKVSSLHLKFLNPLASGIKEILQRFKKVICVEINYSDDISHPMINEDNRRYSSLAWLLRARYLVDVDSWSNVQGQPIKPGEIEDMIRDQFDKSGK